MSAGYILRVIGLVALVCPGMAKAQTDVPSPAIQQEVLKTEAARDEAMQKADMPVLNRIYADDVVIVNTRGVHLTKAQRLADFQSGDLKFLSFDQGDYSFHSYGDTVILNGRANSAVQFHGKINRVPRKFTLTYIKLNGEWRLVAQNETLIDQPQ
ncbi:MAG: nuclear transport factor 2 family protein [Candidatus Sulfotelmatobacter sp.]